MQIDFTPKKLQEANKYVDKLEILKKRAASKDSFFKRIIKFLFN